MQNSKKYTNFACNSQDSNRKVWKMRKLAVYVCGVHAGVLEQNSPHEYVFRYEHNYFADDDKPAISLSMPKSQSVYRSKNLFPVFTNMLSEGYNRRMQSRLMHIDEKDAFALLAATARYDTIGAITVKPFDNM